MTMIQGDEGSVSQVIVWTDASGHFGRGALIRETGDRLQYQWPRTYV